MAGKYKGVSVAEKRELLRNAGEPWPVCECHVLPKRWNKDADNKAGGWWRCAERLRERKRVRYHERYHNDPEWAERKRKRNRLENMTLIQRMRNQSYKDKYNRSLSDRKLAAAMAELGTQ